MPKFTKTSSFSSLMAIFSGVLSGELIATAADAKINTNSDKGYVSAEAIFGFILFLCCLAWLRVTTHRFANEQEKRSSFSNFKLLFCWLLTAGLLEGAGVGFQESYDQGNNTAEAWSGVGVGVVSSALAVGFWKLFVERSFTLDYTPNEKSSLII